MLSVITATFTGPRRKTCKQKNPRGPRLRVQRIVIPRSLGYSSAIGLFFVLFLFLFFCSDRQDYLGLALRASVSAFGFVAFSFRVEKTENKKWEFAVIEFAIKFTHWAVKLHVCSVIIFLRGKATAVPS